MTCDSKETCRNINLSVTIASTVNRKRDRFKRDKLGAACLWILEENKQFGLVGDRHWRYTERQMEDQIRIDKHCSLQGKTNFTFSTRKHTDQIQPQQATTRCQRLPRGKLLENTFLCFVPECAWRECLAPTCVAIRRTTEKTVFLKVGCEMILLFSSPEHASFILTSKKDFYR